MRPHFAHINNTLIKKQLAEDAKKAKTSYEKYRAKADRAITLGFEPEEIIDELELEIKRIEEDQRDSNDPLFQQGVHNAKVACISSIRQIISELKGEQ